MDISTENINLAINRYSKEIELTHGTSSFENTFHATRANAMKQLLYEIGILDDNSNHNIVEEVKNGVEKKKVKLMKKKQVK